MSANDTFHETWFDRWSYRLFCSVGVLFVAGIASGFVYGFWNWLLSGPCVR